MENLSTAELLKHLQDLAARKKQISKDENEIKETLIDRYKLTIHETLSAKPEPFGTVNLDGFSINIPKRVQWDQDKLANLVAEIQHGGENPGDYIDVEYKVPEAKYKNWPEVIVKSFEGARTVSPGAPVIKIKGEE